MVVLFLLNVVVGIAPRALSLLGKNSTTEVYPQPSKILLNE